MEESHILQIPRTIEECIYAMRSYIYIDKYAGEVTIREITPHLAPGFILGLCAHVPFLYEFVEPYIAGVLNGEIVEVQATDEYKTDMDRNDFINSQLLQFQYTPHDCDFVWSVVLTAVIHSVYGKPNRNFKHYVANTVDNITQMAGIYPMNVFFPNGFRYMMKTTLTALPELRVQLMSLLCQNGYPDGNVWSLVKRYIFIQIRNYHMGTFMLIGQWYEAREKTLAHADPEIVDEMKRYAEILEEIKQATAENGQDIGTYRILHPKSMLPYLRQFPASAYCAVQWKKKTNPRWNKFVLDADKFGIDAKSFDKLLDVPVKHTVKRKLTDDEIETISSKRFKVLETEYTANDDDEEEGTEEEQDEFIIEGGVMQEPLAKPKREEPLDDVQNNNEEEYLTTEKEDTREEIKN